MVYDISPARVGRENTGHRRRVPWYGAARKRGEVEQPDRMVTFVTLGWCWWANKAAASGGD
ncbi:hypothetical protein ABH917_001770 [Thermobifida halotolerans]